MAKHTNMLAQAVAHHQAGRAAEAERGYREVLAFLDALAEDVERRTGLSPDEQVDASAA